MSRETKINKLLRLLRGEIKASDLQPILDIRIGYSKENIYLKNGREVSKEVFDQACRDSLEATGCSVTYGSSPGGEEYYR